MGSWPDRSLAYIWPASLAVDRETVPSDDTGECPAQLPVRASRIQDDRALLAAGLDPGIGMFHTDIDGRSSLALDAIEAARPRVDYWLLGYLASSAFANRDFTELSDGEVRLTHPLSRLHRGAMAKGMPADRRLVSAKLLPRSRPWRGGDRRRLHDPGAADDSAKAIGTRAEARSAYTSGADIDWSGPRLLADAAAGQAQGRSGSPDVLGMRKSIGRQTAQILFKRPRHSLLCSAW